MTQRTNISTGAYTVFEWDNRNQLVKVTEKNSSNVVTKWTSYAYDSFGRLVTKEVDPDGAGVGGVTDTFFVYDGTQIVLQLSRAGTSGAANQTNRLLWGPQTDQLLVDEAISTQGVAGTNRWTLGDHLGTIADIATYSSGTTSIANHRTYDSFGRLISESNSAVDEVFGYTGRLFDEDTGLQNNWHRWYDPRFGQWLSEDPVGFVAGDTNLRRYVENFATGTVDPSGLAPPISWEEYENLRGAGRVRAGYDARILAPRIRRALEERIAKHGHSAKSGTANGENTLSVVIEFGEGHTGIGHCGIGLRQKTKSGFADKEYFDFGFTADEPVFIGDAVHNFFSDRAHRRLLPGARWWDAVIGHSNPATRGEMKSSHFEWSAIRRWNSATFEELLESTDGECTQDGDRSVDTTVARGRLVPASHCAGAGDRSWLCGATPTSGITRPKCSHFARRVGRFKSSHFFAPPGSRRERAGR